MSAQSNHARRPNGTATFSVRVGIVRVSGLRHETIQVVISNSLASTLQNREVRQNVSFGSRDSQITAD